ncbi:MAG: transporter ATP-binding protein uup, partial [Pseudomonadota bacterium]
LTQSQRSQAIQAQNKAAAAKQAVSLQNTSTAASSTASPSVASKMEGLQGPGPSNGAAITAKGAAKATVKLSYKEQRELDGLPGLIESLEKEQLGVRLKLGDSNLFAKDPGQATALYARDAEIDAELMQALERWETLSAK